MVWAVQERRKLASNLLGTISTSETLTVNSDQENEAYGLQVLSHLHYTSYRLGAREGVPMPKLEHSVV